MPECKEVLKKTKTKKQNQKTPQPKTPQKNMGDSHWRILVRFPLDKSRIITEAK